MLFKILARNISTGEKRVVELRRENGAFSMNGNNPFFSCDEEVLEINKAVLQDGSPLIWAKEDEIHYFGSRNFWIQTRACR